MTSPETFWLFIIGLIFFVGVLIRNIFKFSSVRTDLLKNYYLWALIINVILIVSLILGLLNQYLPFAILFFGVMIVAMFRYGKSIKAQREEAERVMVKVKDSKLVLSDIFTGKGWIKMALKFGAARATVITFCIGFVILLVLLLMLRQFLPLAISWSEIIRDSLILSLFGSISFYLTVKKAKAK